MSDTEVLSSGSSSERSEEEDSGNHFELSRNFAPYQGKPLTDSKDADMDDDEEDDGILFSVVAQRFHEQIALNDYSPAVIDQKKLELFKLVIQA